MENVLKFPGVYAKKKVIVNPIKRIIDSIKNYQEKQYRLKVKALEEATFNHFMNQLKNIKQTGIQIPDFMTARSLTNREIRKAEAKGKKHIELCFKELKKSAKK